MAGGQGFKGNKGTGEGGYIQVVMDAEDAIVTAQQLDGEVDRLAVSFKESPKDIKPFFISLIRCKLTKRFGTPTYFAFNPYLFPLFFSSCPITAFSI